MRLETVDIEGIATYLYHTRVESGGIPDIGREGCEREEKDGEIREG